MHHLTPTARAWGLLLAGRFLQKRDDNRKRSQTSDLTIAKLPDEILLRIFDFYLQSFVRLNSFESDLNGRNKWFKLAHVCRNWRCIVLSSPSRLRLRLYFMQKTPTRLRSAVLKGLPPLPIVLDYFNVTWTCHTRSRLTSALRYSDRVCGIVLTVATQQAFPNAIPTALNICFPSLECLEIYNITGRIWEFDLPPTFLMTSMKSLWWLKIPPTRLPSLLPLLSATTMLIDLTLSIDSVMSLQPDISLLTLLQCLPHLRHLDVTILDIHTSFRAKPAKKNDTITLAELTKFHLDGYSCMVEVLLAGLATPSLQELQARVNFDPRDELHFPQLTKFVKNVGRKFLAVQIKLPKLNRNDWTVSLLSQPHFMDDPPSFNIIMNGKSSITQIVSGIPTMLAAVEDLFLAPHYPYMYPGSFQLDLAPWLGLFRQLQNVKRLRVTYGLDIQVATMLQWSGRRPTIDLPPTENGADLDATIPPDMRIDSSRFNVELFPSLELIEVYLSPYFIPWGERVSALQSFDAFVTTRRQSGRRIGVYWKSDGELPAPFRRG